MKVIATNGDWLMLTDDDVDTQDGNFISEKCIIIKVESKSVLYSRMSIGSWFNHAPSWTEPTKEYNINEINGMLETFEVVDK